MKRFSKRELKWKSKVDSWEIEGLNYLLNHLIKINNNLCFQIKKLEKTNSDIAKLYSEAEIENFAIIDRIKEAGEIIEVGRDICKAQCDSELVYLITEFDKKDADYRIKYEGESDEL